MSVQNNAMRIIFNKSQILAPVDAGIFDVAKSATAFVRDRFSDPS